MIQFAFVRPSLMIPKPLQLGKRGKNCKLIQTVIYAHVLVVSKNKFTMVISRITEFEMVKPFSSICFEWSADSTYRFQGPQMQIRAYFNLKFLSMILWFQDTWIGLWNSTLKWVNSFFFSTFRINWSLMTFGSSLRKHYNQALWLQVFTKEFIKKRS